MPSGNVTRINNTLSEWGGRGAGSPLARWSRQSPRTPKAHEALFPSCRVLFSTFFRSMAPPRALRKCWTPEFGYCLRFDANGNTGPCGIIIVMTETVAQTLSFSSLQRSRGFRLLQRKQQPANTSDNRKNVRAKCEQIKNALFQVSVTLFRGRGPAMQ